jgi:hypothetical protein
VFLMGGLIVSAHRIGRVVGGLAVALAAVPLIVAGATDRRVSAAGSSPGFSWSDADQERVDEYFPDGVVDDRASVNGCGSQAPGAVDVPDDWFGVSFTPSCDWHDQCYGTKGLTQDYCDRGMLARTVVACDGGVRCLGVAGAYYLGVQQLGEDAYIQGQLQAEERDPCDEAHAHGDPHLETFDGAPISFQAAGVFTLVADRDGPLVQARTYPVSEMFSVLTGVAVRLGEQIVSVEANPDDKTTAVFVDGEPMDDWITAGDGTLVTRTSRPGTTGQITIWRQNEFQADILSFGNSLDVTVRLFDGARAPFSGLLGDNDGDAANDVLGADGQSLPMEAIFGEHLPDSAYVEGFRVAEDRSWFSDAPGFDYHADDIGKHPLRAQSAEAIDDAVLAAARERCQQSGVPSDLLNACAFDVAFGGSDAYAGRSSVSAAHSRLIHAPHHTVDDDEASDQASPDLVVPDTSGLVWAAFDGDVDAVRELLADGADPNSVDESIGYTPLAAGVQSGSVALVEVLLDAGANPDLTPDLGAQVAPRPLTIAAAGGSPEMVGLLLEAGSDPNGGIDVGDDGSTTPLDTAASVGDVAMVRLLLDAGAATDRGLISTMDRNLAVLLFTPEIVELLGF